MKIKKEHYEYMASAIKPFADKIQAHRDFLLEEGRSKNVEMRLRWDMFHVANLTSFACDELYPYLNDTHIDTALRSIMTNINK